MYEVWWVSLHTLTTAVGCLTLYLVHCFPAAYNHLLHRTSLYLGNWAKVASKLKQKLCRLTFNTRVQIEGRISAAFYSQWSAASLWPSNAIVRHGKDLFRAEGVVNAAEPGNTSHTRSEARYIAPQIMSRWGLALIVERGLG